MGKVEPPVLAGTRLRVWWPNEEAAMFESFEEFAVTVIALTMMLGSMLFGHLVSLWVDKDNLKDTVDGEARD